MKTHSELLERAHEFTRYNYRLLADNLGITKQYVSKMMKTNHVPEKYWNKIQEITGGKVRYSHFKKAKSGA